MRHVFKQICLGYPVDLGSLIPPDSGSAAIGFTIAIGLKFCGFCESPYILPVERLVKGLISLAICAWWCHQDSEIVRILYWHIISCNCNHFCRCSMQIMCVLRLPAMNPVARQVRHNARKTPPGLPPPVLDGEGFEDLTLNNIFCKIIDTIRAECSWQTQQLTSQPSSRYFTNEKDIQDPRSLV